MHTYDPATDTDRWTGPDLDLAVRRHGAELIALGLRRGDERIGLLWRDGRNDPPDRYWKSRAPVLFPIVGGLHDHRSVTTDGTPVHFRGLHGFARHSDFALAGAAGDDGRFELRYRLEDSAETRAFFPWRCAVEVAYGVAGRRLDVSIAVTNRDDRPMPFQVGWHPGFNTPLVAGDKADCRLVLPEGIDRLGNDDRCFLTGERQALPGGRLRFTEPELDRTYMLDASAVPPDRRVVELTDPDGATGVRVGFPDFPHLGLWSDAGAPFLCIEPWQGMDDSVVQEPFDRKVGVVLLSPGQTQVRRAWVEAWRR